MNLFEDVLTFNKKFDLPHPDQGAPRLLTLEEAEFRYNFMLEELFEWRSAVERGDLVGAADGLVDLAYVVLGSAAFHRLPFNEIWSVVQQANLQKIKAPSAEHSKRKSSFDVIKPAGWVAPEGQIAMLLSNKGWRR